GSLGLPLAALADRGDRKQIIMASLAVWSAMRALCGLAVAFWQLALARIGVGAGEAGVACRVGIRSDAPGVSARILYRGWRPRAGQSHDDRVDRVVCASNVPAQRQHKPHARLLLFAGRHRGRFRNAALWAPRSYRCCETGHLGFE